MNGRVGWRGAWAAMRHAGWWAWLALAGAWTLGPGCSRPGSVAERAELRMTTAEIGPATGFELVLPEPLVSFAEVGTTLAVPPLVVSPPVPGEFVWRSRRSGVFRPSSAWPLGRTVEFRLRDGLRDEQGRAVAPRWVRRVEMPPFHASFGGDAGGGGLTDWLSSQPEVLIRANAAMDTRDLARRAYFTDGTRRVDARVEGASTNEAAWHQSWADGLVPARTATAAGPAPTREAGAVLKLLPAAPLVSTNTWKVVVRPGLRSASGLVMREGVEAVLGRSLPFEVDRWEARSTLRRGRELVLTMTRPAALAVVTNVASWLEVEPRVEGLVADVGWGGRDLRVRGPFLVGSNYVVRLGPALHSWDDLPLVGTRTRAMTFEPLAPNAWLPVFEAVQASSGSRGLELLSVNVPEVRVRVKALDRHGLIPTLRGYERYRRDGDAWTADTVAGAALDYAGVPGRTVHDAVVDLGPVLMDEPRRTPLGWDRLAGPGKAGAFFVEVDLHGLGGPSQGTRVGPQALVQCTDLGHVVKRGGGKALAWVFRHRDARPVAGARVSLRTDENEELAWASTDASGLAQLASPTNAAWVLVEQGDDLHAARMEGDSLNLWNHRLEGRELPESGLRLLGFVDRTLARPGEVVHVKWVGRRRGASGWTLPGTNGVALELKGPRDEVLARTNVALGAEGTGSLDWAIPSALRGTVTLEARLGDAAWQAAVNVREFQAPAFEARLDMADVLAPGDPVRATLGASSLQGRPLAGAKVQWFGRATDMGNVPGAWAGFGFIGPAWSADGEEPAPREAFESGELALDATGAMVIEPRLPMNESNPCPQSVQVEVDVTDLDRNSISQSREVVRHASAFYLGHRWTGGDEFTPEVGRTLPLEVAAMAMDGSPWKEKANVRVRLLRVERVSVALQQAGGGIGRETRTRLVEVGTVSGEVTPAEREGTGWRATTVLALPPPPGPGEYHLELTSTDPSGRRVLTRGVFHVAGDARLAWHWKAGQRLELVPLRSGEPTPGTNWPLLAKAPFPGTALVTVERGGVSRAFVAELRGNAPQLDIPLEAGDAPNAFVGVLMVRGIEGNPHEHPIPEWRAGYAAAWMPAKDRRLTVTVAAQQPALRPREQAIVTVDVRDARGRPVQGAEVTVYAVDDAVLNLAGTPPPDLSGALEEPLALGVQTSVSLRSILPEDPALRRFANKGAAGGGGGRELMVRSNFEPAPYWNPGLRTDASGRAEARFAVPDSLTRYRLVAVALHGVESAGTGAGALRVEKPLMIEPSLPRFAHVGDRLVARAMVINARSNTVEARVTVRTGTNVVASSAAGLDMRVTVPPGGAVPVDVEVACASAGSDPWIWRVEGGGEADASEATMPVMEPLPELRDGRWVRAASGRASLLDGLDAAALEVGTELTVRVGRGPWALVGEGVGHLLHYPYGCAEQTVSSLLPWLALRDQPTWLSQEGLDPARAVAAGMDRLWGMQTASGGLAYWPGEREPQRWASAYGAWAMAVALKQGLPVDSSRLARLHAWLNEQWRKDGPDLSAEVLHERCLTAFALAEAGKPETGLHEALMSVVDSLTREDRCLLAMAWVASGGAKPDAQRWLAMPRRPTDRPGRFGNEGREAALELIALERCGAGPADLAARVARLLGQRAGGHWGTTQGNAWAVWALASLARPESAGEPVVGEVRVGERTSPVRMESVAETRLLSWAVTPEALRSGVEWIHGGGPEAWLEVGVSGRMRSAPGSLARMGAVDRGFSVRRTYQRLDLENRAGTTEGWTAGDRVLVTIEIDVPEPAQWVAIDDPVPSVLEPSLERWLGAEARLDPWDRWQASFVEVRGDRRRVFIDSLDDGRHRVRYVARVRAAGTAVAGPVKVEAMYEPGRHGLSAPATVTAR